LTPLKYNNVSYTTNLPGDTKYFLTSLSLAVTEIIVKKEGISRSAIIPEG
jgi:hypothetical protein